MRFYKLVIFLLLYLSYGLSPLWSQCYKETLQSGIKYYNVQNYTQAKKTFTAARNSCDDSPSNKSEIDGWIGKCDAAVRTQSGAARKREVERQTQQTVSSIMDQMVFVKGGTFQMKGLNYYETEHSVTLSDYYIGKYEVTQALWQTVMGSNQSHFKGASLPVEQVSWNDCQTFIKKLNKMTGKHFRLPTEAEWEYAARGGSQSRDYEYSGSNTLGDVAWFLHNSGKKTHVIGTKKPNELGIYDMTGNVEEWCSDWVGEYSTDSQTNPTGPISGTKKIARGGCWDYESAGCYVIRRAGGGCLDDSWIGLGLRLALTP